MQKRQSLPKGSTRNEDEKFFRITKIRKDFTYPPYIKWENPGKFLFARSKFLPTKKSIKLIPDWVFFKDINWRNIVASRKSENVFKRSHSALKKSELASLLTLSMGKKKYISRKYMKSGGFTYPSAGGLYSLEFYVLVHDASDLEKGLFYFNSKKNSLDLMRKDDAVFQFNKYLAQYEIFGRPSVTIFVTSIFEKSRMKYGPRALRFIFMETGGVGLHLNFLCTIMNIGFCFDGSGYDEEIESILGIDGRTQGLVGIFHIG